MQSLVIGSGAQPVDDVLFLFRSCYAAAFF
jgi:hypothetical protein